MKVKWHKGCAEQHTGAADVADVAIAVVVDCTRVKMEVLAYSLLASYYESCSHFPHN